MVYHIFYMLLLLWGFFFGKINKKYFDCIDVFTLLWLHFYISFTRTPPFALKYFVSKWVDFILVWKYYEEYSGFFLLIKIKQNSSQLYFETKKYTQDSPWIIHFSSFKRDRLVCLKIFFLIFGQIKITVVIKDFDLGVILYTIQVLARKIAHKVELCPKNTNEWQIASRRLNCTNDISNPKNRYHCLPANDLSTLVEFCYDETRLGVVKGI